MTTLQHAPLIVGVAASVLGLFWAAVSDVTRYEIPNRACGLVGAGYILAAFATPMGPWLAGLATGAAVFAACLALFWRGWLGGGDVKLAAVVVLWAGPAHLTDFALAAALTSLALGAVLLSPLRRRMPKPPTDVADDFRHPMPYGAPLAVGGVWVTLLHLAPHAIGA
ncbi:MAG: prepilin peptidase [Phenylobacterium sp.]|nr:MAG: prepilin peptidase [Phenylobacterium sp.]